MVTVSHLVKSLIHKRPLLEEFLKREIINYGALAEEFKPAIELELGKDVKTSAIMMAIRRYSETINSSKFHNIKFHEDMDLSLKSDLVEITVYRNENTGHLIEELNKIVNVRRGDFLSTITGNNELSIVTNNRNKQKILNLFSEKLIINIQTNLAGINLSLPKDSITQPGLFYTLTKGLYFANISIIEIISTMSECIFILNEKDAPFAYVELKKVLDDHR